jgi:tripartite-type tricarboxylate transporter receptor subunit TctC
MTVSPVLVIAKRNFPANDLKEMIAWLKANPDQASAATVGVGSAAHVSGAYFQKVTGTRFHFVPYRGGGPAMQDLVGGQVDLQFAEGTTALPAVRSRQVKTYAVMAPTRWFATPDVPTVDELGMPGLYLTFWHGLWVPKGTSDQIIAKLNAAVVDALADAAVRRRLTDIGQEIMPRAQQTPEALAAYHKAEAEKWWPIIRAANIRGGVGRVSSKAARCVGIAGCSGRPSGKKSAPPSLSISAKIAATSARSCSIGSSRTPRPIRRTRTSVPAMRNSFGKRTA